MIRKFAVLAVVASIFVACGSGQTPEQIEAAAKATADSIANALDQSMKQAEAAAKAAADSAAAAAATMMDSTATKMEEAAH